MSREVLLLVDALAREKNVDKDVVFGALEHAPDALMNPSVHSETSCPCAAQTDGAGGECRRSWETAGKRGRRQ